MAIKTLPDQAYLRECFDYDPVTGKLTWRLRPPSHFANIGKWRGWNTRWAGRSVGHVNHGANGDDYFVTAVSGLQYRSHRLIWKWIHGTEPPEVDHWNGDGTDNVLTNLRPSDRSGNAKNRRSRKPAGMKGIRPRPGGWEANITADRVTRYLGTFVSRKEAHAAYCKAAIELHGEFANFGEDRHSILP